MAQHAAAREEDRLVEADTGLGDDIETVRDQLEPQFAGITAGDTVVTRTAVGQHAGGQIDAPGRAFAIGIGFEMTGQAQPFVEQHQIDLTAAKAHRHRQVDFLQGQAAHQIAYALTGHRQD